MKYLNYGDITVYEDLSYRLQLNYTRMECEWYKPEVIFTADMAGWPADSLLIWKESGK